ncbi:hypothetical protein D3C78_1582360 [compost metagenome]
MRHVNRVGQVDRINVRHPEQITVGGVPDFVQGLNQLGVGHFQLGQLENLGIAAGKQ